MSSGVQAPAFPAPFPSGFKSIRFYQTGSGTANFADNQWPFLRVDPATPGTPEQGWSGNILVRCTGAAVDISFDGTNVHGHCLSGGEVFYQHRFEGGISVRGAGATFYIEAW